MPARFLLSEGIGVEVIYCRDAEKAMWFLPGSGMGVVQPKGVATLKEIVDAP